MSGLRYIDRKELARLLELSVRSVKNNEVRWGIDQYRADANSRVKRFQRGPTLVQLRKIKVLLSV
ncbi:MAG: hypothetical protein JWQ04_2775 [Pedosphaera sp.]|nr:hypothetical protein [Pedosphaera sp.]